MKTCRSRVSGTPAKTSWRATPLPQIDHVRHVVRDDDLRRRRAGLPRPRPAAGAKEDEFCLRALRRGATRQPCRSGECSGTGDECASALRPHENNTRARAMAPGTACTQRIFRLAVRAPNMPARVMQARKKILIG